MATMRTPTEHITNLMSVVDFEPSQSAHLAELIASTQKLTRLANLALVGLLVEADRHVLREEDLRVIQELTRGAELYAESAEAMYENTIAITTAPQRRPKGGA
jgi:hypothetical protein